MGEAKRRRQQDTNWGTSTPKNQIQKTLRYVKKMVGDLLIKQPHKNSVQVILTNKELGYEPDFIEEFRSAIRQHKFPCQVSVLMLPRQYASLPPSKALEKLVEVYKGSGRLY